MRETIVHFWCDRCGAQYVPPQEDANTIPAILKVAPSASEATGMDLCPKCSEEYYALIEEFKSTTGNETIATPSESDIVATEPEPMGWEDWLENIKPIPNFTPPSVIELTTPSVPNWIPKCCRSCSNHPINGGSGFCNCTLPYLENSTTGSIGTNTIITTSTLRITPEGYIEYKGDTSNDNQK